MARKAKGFVESIIEKFGDTVLDNHTKEVQAITTGSLSLDAAIGVGGIPRGMVTELYGAEGSGKTTVALNVAKGLAQSGGKTLYVDTENLLNQNILKAALGEDTKIENIVIVTPDSAEDAFMIAEAGIDSGEFELIVIDSIGAMASKQEKEKPFDKASMGQLPQLVSRFLKRNIYSIRTGNIAVLAVNQVRDDIGAYIKTFKTPGGHQLQHQAAVRISLSRGQKIKNGEEVVGILVKFVVTKNKLSAPFRSYMISLMFGEGIDFYSDLIDFSKLIGVIQQNGPYYVYEGETLGKGKAATVEYLKNSKETLDKIVEMVYNVINKQPVILDLEELEETEGETE